MSVLQFEIAQRGPRIELVPQMECERGGMRLTSPMRAVDSLGRVFVVAEGFHTDFESVPSIARVVVGWLLGDPWTTALAGVLHDGLYKSQEISRAEADLVFWEILGLLDPRPRRGPAANWIKWASVRSFGFLYWNRRSELPSGSRTEGRSP